MRQTLDPQKVHPAAITKSENFHPWIVQEVQGLINQHEWVVVGMAQNPVVSSARRFLKDRNIPFHYVQYGSYVSMWKPRLALKMWTGWPTFPQIFHKGVLIGGFSDLKVYLQDKAQ